MPTVLSNIVLEASQTMQLDQASLVSRVLVKCITLLPTYALSEKCKEFLIKESRINLNIDTLESVTTNLYALKSDDLAKKATVKKTG